MIAGRGDVCVVITLAYWRRWWAVHAWTQRRRRLRVEFTFVWGLVEGEIKEEEAFLAGKSKGKKMNFSW